MTDKKNPLKQEAYESYELIPNQSGSSYELLFKNSKDSNFVRSVVDLLDRYEIKTRVFGSIVYNKKQYDDIDFFGIGRPYKLKQFYDEFKRYMEHGTEVTLLGPYNDVNLKVMRPVVEKGKSAHHHWVLDRLVLTPTEDGITPIDLSLITNGNFNRLKGKREPAY
ncbi:MAG: hypothetical protein WC867_03640 [Candidatus Pacearchaeota archaeon]|jgi:hypothetical protein